MNDTTLAEIAKLILTHPKIVSGFVQENHGLEEHVVAKVPGGAGATLKGQKYYSEYRVFLRTDADDPKGGKVHADRTGTDLPTVIRQAFDACKLEMPRS